MVLQNIKLYVQMLFKNTAYTHGFTAGKFQSVNTPNDTIETNLISLLLQLEQSEVKLAGVIQQLCLNAIRIGSIVFHK